MAEYVGLDVGKEETAYCVKDASGEVLARGKVSSDPRSIVEALGEVCECPERIVLETGSMSGWLQRGLSGFGLPVVVVDARRAHTVMRLKHNKTDPNDAEMLAELARTGFYWEVAVKSLGAQEARALLKAREQLVRQSRSMDNCIRGLLRSFGIRLAKGRGKFVGRVRAALGDHPELVCVIAPLLLAREALEASLAKLDGEVQGRAKGSPVCQLLMTAPGVGPVTSLCFAATIDDATRFSSSRAVGAYLGLTSRRYQSGEMDVSGRISKMGDDMLRSHLYEAANSILSVVRRAHPLKSWGLKLKKKVGHKKACVALARKLAVVLHRMWLDGAEFRWPEKKAA